ncbi:GH25 family lysozyme [Limosilactobacillus vaginalis]|uniref:GH25 family lysozyme n=1 Tax=Limosilactobacillus vaginalis TaxID=1633 RepID=UPI0022E88B6D|nr:GH25 family lysozyme [Limosilactobacillus vaginalis]
MTTPNVIDISQWQGTGSSIDFANLKSNGIKAVIIRLGHGTTTDPSAKSFITAVQKAGLRIHGYHYYEGVSGELEFTIKNASSLGLPLESYYFLDMEGKISGNWADIFRTYYTSWLQVGRRVGLYVSDSPYKQYFDDNELTGHGVYRWIASYSYEPTNYDTWQFNSQGGWGNYTSNLDKDYDKTGYLINGSTTIKTKDDSDPNKEYQVVAGAFVGFDYSTTKLQGGKMLIHSPNGVDKIPSISPRGLEFDQPAADRLWPYLKKYVTPGKDGKDGKSAYEIACDNGFKGSEAEWLQSLHGKDGSATALSGSGMSIDTEKGTIAFTGKMADPASAESKEEVPYTIDINNSGISYTVGGKTTQLVSITDSGQNNSQQNKVDQSNTDKNKVPSDYSDGIFYEQKTAAAVDIDRTDYADAVKSGTTGILTTKAVTIDKKKYARQSFELLDNDYPLTLERNGSDSAWEDWHAVTNWN